MNKILQKHNPSIENESPERYWNGKEWIDIREKDDNKYIVKKSNKKKLLFILILFFLTVGGLLYLLKSLIPWF